MKTEKTRTSGTRTSGTRTEETRTEETRTEGTRAMSWQLVHLVLGSILLCPLLAAAGDPVCFEAESAISIVPHLQVGDATATGVDPKWGVVEGSSAGKYIEIPQGKNPKSPPEGEKSTKPPVALAGEATYTFSVAKTGIYYMWCRAWWLDRCGNSVGVSLDGGLPFSLGQDGTCKCWHWVKSPPRIKQLKLSAGTHTLTLMNREDGIRIDQILFTDSKRYVPVGIEDVTIVSPGEER